MNFNTLALSKKPGKPGRPAKNGGVSKETPPQYSTDLETRIRACSFVFRAKSAEGEGDVVIDWKSFGPRPGKPPHFRVGLGQMAQVLEIISRLAADEKWIVSKLEESAKLFASSSE